MYSELRAGNTCMMYSVMVKEDTTLFVKESCPVEVDFLILLVIYLVISDPTFLYRTCMWRGRIYAYLKIYNHLIDNKNVKCMFPDLNFQIILFTCEWNFQIYFPILSFQRLMDEDLPNIIL